MTKLYYTDAIKAAWMCREYGVHFTEPLALGFHNGQYVIALSPHLDMSKDAKYYIHPDSLPIFEPMDGDVYEVDVTEDVPVYHENAKSGDAPMYYTSRSSPYSQFQVYRNNPNGAFKRIVERNGKAFFMPEQQV